MRKPYNTPHRTHVVKTRLTDEEHELFLNQCRTYGISQSEMLRQSMTRLQIKPVIHVSAVNDELLAAIGKLTAEYGRIGNNLNQIAAKAHTLNALDVQRYDENCRKLDEAIKTITAAVILPRPMK